MWDKLFKEIYNVELNGFAIIGWVVASLYGCYALVKEVISCFN